MKLGTKLANSTGVLISAMILTSLVAYVRIQQTNDIAERITGTRLPRIMMLWKVRSNMSYLLREQEAYMLLGRSNPGVLDWPSRQTVTAAAAHTLIELSNTFAGAEQEDGFHDRFAQINSQFESLKLAQDKIERLTETGTPQSLAQAQEILSSEVLPHGEATMRNAEDISDSEIVKANDDTDRLRRSSSLTLYSLVLATLLGALVGGIISFTLGRHIIRSVRFLADRANAIASGDLTGKPLEVDSDDQIGSLAHAMGQMQERLATIIRTVTDTARSLTTSSISMSAATDHMHRRVNEQAQQTEQAATSMQEMSASIAEVSRHTRSAAETARSAAQTAREGGAIVQQMLGSMHSIATAVSDTSATVGLLGEDSRRISQIVTVIDEIATKTNLLALNAAIEAARAGEHGRGFAVVAAEVRRLAESTAQATGEISAMIQGIQQRTHTAVASMASGTITVEQGVATTNRAGEALERIIGIAEQVDRMIAQIAIAASQQAAAAGQSSSSLDAIHSLSFDNLSEMATTTLGIESLRATAAALESQVKRFRVELSPTDINPARDPLEPRPLPHPGFA